MQQADDECEGSEKPSSAFDTESDEQEEIHDSSKSGKKKPSVLVEPCPLTLLDTRQILARRLIIELGSLGRPLRTGTAPAHPAILTAPPALPAEDPARPRADCSAIPRVVFTHSGFTSTSDQLLC